jgi:hypothetical protein
MAKSKRSKHMRAMRKILREKLSKKDEAKRLASLKNDKLIRKRYFVDFLFKKKELFFSLSIN